MRTIVALPLVALLLLSGRALAGAPARAQEQDPETAARQWIARADSVRGVVESVLQSAVEAGAEKHPVAQGNVADARRWQEEAAKAMEAAKTALEADEVEKAETQGNMAWQYYVKAGTAAVLAARLVGVG